MITKTLTTKILVNTICLFVPVKKWRKAIRHNLITERIRRKELLDYGCKTDGDILTTPQGIRIDISKTLDNPLFSIIEVFFKSEYNLNIKKESILIDIGMNRAITSLLFAADENIKRIYAYEPFKPTFEKAEINLKLNPKPSEKITPFNYGLGQKDTTLDLPYAAEASVGMSTTHNVCKNKRNIKEEKVVIKDAAKEISRVLEANKNKYIIVKCDCEGAEFEIFERLNEENIVGGIDVVMMEYHFEKPDEIINILTENGFAVQAKKGSAKSQTGYIYAVRMRESS